MHTHYCDGNFYHVFNRGVHRSAIFFAEENYRYCLGLMGKNSMRYQVSVVAYCLMPNHFHFVLHQQDGGTITRFLQTTFNAYVQAINRREAMCGTLFQGRAQGVYVPSEKYLARLLCYVHCNPVSAGLVRSAQEWRFSDCAEWIRERGCKRKELRELLFGSGEDYRAILERFARLETPCEGLKPL